MLILGRALKNFKMDTAHLGCVLICPIFYLMKFNIEEFYEVYRKSMNSSPKSNSFYSNSICGVSVIFILQFLIADYLFLLVVES